MTKYDSKTKDGKCVFCEIINGNLKTPGIFWQNKNFIAFLSLFPNMEGVVAVVPKKHYASDVLSMPDKKLSEFVITAKHVSKILLKHFKNVGRIGLVMEGVGIDHAHIKLYPMHGTKHLKQEKWQQRE